MEWPGGCTADGQALSGGEVNDSLDGSRDQRKGWRLVGLIGISYVDLQNQRCDRSWNSKFEFDFEFNLNSWDLKVRDPMVCFSTKMRLMSFVRSIDQKHANEVAVANEVMKWMKAYAVDRSNEVIPVPV